MYAMFRFLALSLALALSAEVCLASPIVQAMPPAHGTNGYLLVSELSCAACHEQLQAPKRAAPILTNLASEAAFIREFLRKPSGAKPSTSMPDLLHGMSETGRSETAEALTHFLFSLRENSTNEPVAADLFKIREGRKLYHQIGCVACHQPFEAASSFQSSAQALSHTEETNKLFHLAQTSVPLGPLAKKYRVESLAAFLREPLSWRPSSRMPDFKLTENEAISVAMYLLRDQVPELLSPTTSKQRLAGLFYQYFEETFSEDVPNLRKLQPVQTGVTPTFDLSPRKREHNIGLIYNGFIRVPMPGAYTFFSYSDDGTQLFIGDKLVVDNNGMHAAEEKQGTIALTAGDHPITVTYYNGGGESALRVSWQGPSMAKQVISASSLTHMGQAMLPLEYVVLKVQAALASKGKELFGKLGCNNCHTLQQEKLPSVAIRRMDGGCLAASPPPNAAHYQLSEPQRLAMQQALPALLDPAKRSLNDEARLTHELGAFGCLACHQRDQHGGPAPERNDYLALLAEADLGDEGRIPPHLDGVGRKLKPEWLEKVLAGEGRVRPYMATRMPGYRGVNQLRNLLSQSDGAGKPAATVSLSLRGRKLGRHLVGTGGLSCISCHTFAGRKSLGIPAMDLTFMPARLQQAWFHDYLIDPQSLRPGTRMPSFWPMGKAVNREILDGDTEKQIEAIWQYLSQASQTDLPHGLVQGKKELVADKEAIIYRNFIQGAGQRGIGVGYPEKANLAFDAEDLRLALIWQGSFIDAARHSTGRGDGFEPPLGHNVISLPTGTPFAFLKADSSPWPPQSGKAAGARMLGYELDSQQRPAFSYRLGEIKILDRPIADVHDLEPFLRRSFSLAAPRDTAPFYFRAAIGKSIQATKHPLAERAFIVDGKLVIGFKGAIRPFIRQGEAQMELIAQIEFQNGEAEFEEVFIW